MISLFVIELNFVVYFLQLLMKRIIDFVKQSRIINEKWCLWINQFQQIARPFEVFRVEILRWSSWLLVPVFNQIVMLVVLGLVVDDKLVKSLSDIL